MSTVLIKLSGVLMQFVLFIGQLSTNVACAGEFYQPKVPEAMRKNELFFVKDINEMEEIV